MFHLITGKYPNSEESIIFKIEMLDHYIQAAAQEYKVDPNIIKAIAYHETGGDISLGLMKVLPIAWKQINIDFPELEHLDYTTYHTDAEINITFGAATLKNLKKSLKKDLKIEENHPQYLFLLLTTYNAGTGTMRSAYNRAKTAGSNNPYEDLIKPEYMKAAIRSAIFKKEPNVCENKVNSKYKEICNYAFKVQHTATRISNSKQYWQEEINNNKGHYAQFSSINEYKNIHLTNAKNSMHKSNNLIVDFGRIEKALKNNEYFIYQPVGLKQINNPTDVIIIKMLLHQHQYLDFDTTWIATDLAKAISINDSTVAAIQQFQHEKTDIKKIDKIIDPNGKTFTALIKKTFSDINNLL